MMRKKRIWIVAGMAVAALAFGIAMRPARTELAAIKGLDTVEIPTSSIAPGDVRFFAYRTNTGGEVRVIVGRDERGKIQAVLDACERCYMYHRGYKAAHGVMTCQWCGTRYKIGSMSTGLASCVPIKLPFKAAGQTIQIQTAELERQSKLF